MSQVTNQAAELSSNITLPREFPLTDALKWGGLGGLTVIFISAIGMIEAFAGRVLIQPFLTLSYVSLGLIPVS
jgi:hypothetical protein